jgi:hypothetical protein
MCRMFQTCNEGLVIVGWIKLIFMKQVLFKYIYVCMLPVPKIRSGIDSIGSL